MTNNEKIVIEFDVIVDNFNIDEPIDSNVFTSVLLDEVLTNPSNVLRILEINIKKENISLEQCIVEQNFIGSRIYEITEQEKVIQRRRNNFMKIYSTVLALANNEPIATKAQTAHVEQEPIENVVDGNNVQWDLKQKKVTKEGRPRIGKIELTERIAAAFKLPKTRSKTFVTYMFDEIRLSLIQGEGVWIEHFGNWVLERRAAKMGINPLTGESIQIPEATVVKLKSTAHLKSVLNQK
ncbi:HU family DNA-binding protein [Spiroplasma endosymbiont of Othius punctulatus]|uniref:HU family DNA-binding protein n=1 Tax=Spiroplasma endosymbiont of Othius punctulatus TaxID=3066289 RepID=UPI0030CDC61B